MLVSIRNSQSSTLIASFRKALDSEKIMEKLNDITDTCCTLKWEVSSLVSNEFINPLEIPALERGLINLESHSAKLEKMLRSLPREVKHSISSINGIIGKVKNIIRKYRTNKTK